MSSRFPSREGFCRALGAIAIAVGLASGSAAREIPADDQCAVCHAELDETVDVAQFFAVDVHAREGLSCTDCHGGDSTSDDEDVAMSEEAGFLGVPGPLDIPDACARCHSDPSYMRRHNPALAVDQLTLYRTSRHGILNAAGDSSVAQCVSCHGIHDIRPASEPKSPVHPSQVATTCGHCHSDPDRMAPYGIPTDQEKAWSSSVHGALILEGRDLSAPTCNDCHGDHGALPPEVDSAFGVCGHCHALNRDLYQESQKKIIFDDLDEPGCVTCHGNHAVVAPTDEMIGFTNETICSDCHDDDGSDSAIAIARMRSALDSLRIAVDEARALLHDAEQRGMYVTDIEFRWNDARQKLFQARTEVHRFDAGALETVTGEGQTLALEIKEEALGELAAYRFRRSGLFVATGIITLLAVSLYFRIRRLDAH